ncbi:uncharacterized protein LOC115573518 isoform X2 [Sparus aurata]|uniref:uncharacterized protein LOC115573518 isoform X2 n=1 Tax=Sparus aurata TaxID=8175 RepID=UPI0011C18A86|nr:uncharacterized protein LOC115573518 isoform X2 [Sparus aurata]
MVQFRWIKTSIFAILLLLLTVTGLNPTSVTARVGDEVTLPCDNVINTQDKCDSTSWLASHYERESAKQLVNLGQISKSEIPKSRSDRLSVTESCSLVITNVSVEDVGRYSCRQFNKSGRQQGEDVLVYLSVVNMEKLQLDDRDMLTCTVKTYSGCWHTVKWLYDDNMDGVETVPLGCSAKMTYKPPHLNHKSNYHKLPECEVTDDQSGQTLLWKVNSVNDTEANQGNSPPGFTGWWKVTIVAVGFVALLIIAIAVIRWKKAKGNKTQKNYNTGEKLNPAVTQSSVETSQDMVEPEDGVSYASISYTKMTSSRPQVCGKGENDEGDAVTYSTVKASCFSAEPSADPSSLYATVNKPNKIEATV